MAVAWAEWVAWAEGAAWTCDVRWRELVVAPRLNLSLARGLNERAASLQPFFCAPLRQPSMFPHLREHLSAALRLMQGRYVVV